MHKILTAALILFADTIHADSSCAEHVEKHFSCDIR
jgi:hypothetical protein